MQAMHDRLLYCGEGSRSLCSCFLPIPHFLEAARVHWFKQLIGLGGAASGSKGSDAECRVTASLPRR